MEKLGFTPTDVEKLGFTSSFTNVIGIVISSSSTYVYFSYFSNTTTRFFTFVRFDSEVFDLETDFTEEGHLTRFSFCREG